MDGLGYVFSVFSTNILRQLVLLSPFLLCGIGLFLTSSRILLRRKQGRQLLGASILITIPAYLFFSLIEISLPFTNTSYGAAQPVIVVFGLVFLIVLNLWLIGLVLLTRSPRIARRWRGLTLTYAVLQIFIVSTLFYAFYIEPQWLDVTQTEVKLAKLPPGTAPIKVALISDIHMERWTQRETEAIRQFNAIQPDLIMIAGDHINIDHFEPAAYNDLHRFFATLHAKYGVYAVAGGVDAGYDLAGMLSDTGVKLIDDENTLIQVKGVEINLTGVRHHFAEADTPVLAELNSALPKAALKMLIYHTPDLAPEAVAEGYDFYFAGHTHGGQIALPFYGALFTASKYGRKYAAGLYNLGGEANTRLYVTRGIGMEGLNTPRARLFARPEISVITFVPER